MTCETARRAIGAAGDGAWPADVQAHLGGCEACAILVVESSLREAPPLEIPATFAVDVARRARLEPETPSARSTGLAIGLAAAAMLLLAAVGVTWPFTVSGQTPGLQAAVLLLACGEAIVLAAWSLVHVGGDTSVREEP